MLSGGAGDLSLSGVFPPSLWRLLARGEGRLLGGDLLVGGVLLLTTGAAPVPSGDRPPVNTLPVGGTPLLGPGAIPDLVGAPNLPLPASPPRHPLPAI